MTPEARTNLSPTDPKDVVSVKEMAVHPQCRILVLSVRGQGLRWRINRHSAARAAVAMGGPG